MAQMAQRHRAGEDQEEQPATEQQHQQPRPPGKLRKEGCGLLQFVQHGGVL